MLRVGIAGMGFMGWIHYLAYEKSSGAQLAAISTRDPKKLAGDWSDIQGNFGPPGRQVDLTNIRTYSDLDQLLADPDIDLIDICLPPHMHADVAVAALKAGKHVFCEKPMALTIAECRRMVGAAEKAGKQLMIGHVLPFFPEYAYARQLIDKQTYGKVLGGIFKRVISDPLWLRDFYDPQRVGGPLVDLHVHDAHFIRLIFGMPESLSSQGRMRGDVVEFCSTIFRFPDAALSVLATSGVINQQGRSFTHGFEIHFERATLQYEMAVVGGKAELLMPLTIYDDKGEVERPELGEHDPIDAFVKEIADVVHSIETAHPSAILGGDLARDAIQLCHKQTEAVRKGKPVKI